MNMQIARLNNHRPSKKKDGREASCKAQAQEEGKKGEISFFMFCPIPSFQEQKSFCWLYLVVMHTPDLPLHPPTPNTHTHFRQNF